MDKMIIAADETKISTVWSLKTPRLASAAPSKNAAALDTCRAGKLTFAVSNADCSGNTLRKSLAMRCADLDMGPTPYEASNAGRTRKLRIAHASAIIANILENLFI
jgi:hypothetical protein